MISVGPCPWRLTCSSSQVTHRQRRALGTSHLNMLGRRELHHNPEAEQKSRVDIHRATKTMLRERAANNPSEGHTGETSWWKVIPHWEAEFPFTSTRSFSLVCRRSSVSCPSSTPTSSTPDSLLPVAPLDSACLTRLPACLPACLSHCLSAGRSPSCGRWESLTDFLNRADGSVSQCSEAQTCGGWRI